MTYIRVRNTINVVHKKVLDVYFASQTEETVFETVKGKESEHIVKKGDNLSAIASKNKITLAKLKKDNTLKSNTLKIGQKLTIKQNDTKTEKGKKVTFTKLDKATLGEKIYIIIKTKNLDGIEIEINVMQGKEKLLVDKDRAISLLKDDKKKLKAIVGKYAKNDKITNKDDFKDWAIAKVTLAPKEEKTLKSYTKALKDAADKKTYLFLAVNACTAIDDQTEFYKDGKIKKINSPNYYLNEESEWLEFEGCECCYMSVDKDGFVSNPKITKKQVKALEKNGLTSFKAVVLHRTVSSNYKFPLKSFESGVGTHFLMAKDGTIYQTAFLNFRTSHVGKIRSRCFEEDNTLCSSGELKILKSWEDKGASKAAKPVHDIEKIKNYPIRYPTNMDSIGIEVVGNYINNAWETLPKKQISAVVCLVNFLMTNFKLNSKSDLYTHEQISRKHEGEGGFTLNLIKNLIN